MNDNQFMGHRIEVENGELSNKARQSIRGAPDSLVDDASMTINSWGSE